MQNAKKKKKKRLVLEIWKKKKKFATWRINIKNVDSIVNNKFYWKKFATLNIIQFKYFLHLRYFKFNKYSFQS